MKAKAKSIQCGDWHLGWGYGGHNHVGKLAISGDISANRPYDTVFKWSGSSLGRHGQSWNKGAECTFILTDDSIKVLNQKYTKPEISELRSGAIKLLKTIKLI